MGGQANGSPACCPCCAGIFDAVKQLRAAAQVLAWALHTGNPRLAGVGPLVVEGVVGVANRVVPSSRREWSQVADRQQVVRAPGVPEAALRLRLVEV